MSTALGAAVSTWTSLEVAKLAVDGLTPMAVALVGLYVHSIVVRIEKAQWTSQKVIERRLEAYDRVAKKLNTLYCYMMYVGDWKEVEPLDIIAIKRELDREFHLAAPIFSRELLTSYNGFIETCFQTYRGRGRDAGIRTGLFSRREALGDVWKPDWERCFVEKKEERSTRNDIETAYQVLIGQFASELELRLARKRKWPRSSAQSGRELND